MWQQVDLARESHMYCPQLRASKCYGPFAGMRIVREVRRSAYKTSGTGLGALSSHPAQCRRLAAADLSVSRPLAPHGLGGRGSRSNRHGFRRRAIRPCRYAHKCATRHVLPAAACEQMLRTFCRYAHRARSLAVRLQNFRHRAGRAFDPPGALLPNCAGN